ncbi:MAG: helix-turn-helix transcriptional regulator [Planctomycetota bacterium]|nr:helix-turn-helix transcriptional regulator [Planctomycetota bacterium]
MSISDQIRLLCARLNISKAELARRTGQSPQAFSAKLERQIFTIDELDKLAQAVGAKFERAFVLPNDERI